MPVEGAADAVRALGRRYRAPLTRGLPGEDLASLLRAHPFEGTWSALEYGCHVRDVLSVQRDRLAQALREEVPAFAPMRREERVSELRYNEQDPVDVADAVASNAVALADDVATLAPGQFERRVVYGYPEPAERTLLWFVRHTVHEGHHHLLDIGRVLKAARGR